ncbi:MAG: tetratricopeptide repeat protein [Thermoanaerobaculia bacterium]
MSDRLTRKEMKREDSFQVFMARALGFVQEYRRALILTVVLMVVAVLAGVGWFIYLEATEDDAQRLLADAVEAYGAPIEPEEEAGADAGAVGEDGELSFPTREARRERAAGLFRRVLDEYGASDAAGVARAYLGEIAAAQGEAEQAEEHWREFLDDEPDHALAAEVRLNLYALMRGAGQGEEVAAELREMIERERRPLPQDVALYELALTLEELGREEDATIYYQRLVDEFSDSPYAAAAREKTGETGVQGMQGMQGMLPQAPG